MFASGEINGGVTLRIQSKATGKPYMGKRYEWSCSASRPKRPLTKADTDLVAFVALDVRRCVFMPIEELDQQVTYRRPVTDMYIPTIESDTLEKASHFYF